jgi:hypothetical protein
MAANVFGRAIADRHVDAAYRCVVNEGRPFFHKQFAKLVAELEMLSLEERATYPVRTASECLEEFPFQWPRTHRGSLMRLHINYTLDYISHSC